MSRIGNKFIEIPKGVTIKLTAGKITVTGTKGSLERVLSDKVKVIVEDNKIKVAPVVVTNEGRAFQGLFRALIANMVKGVSEGFEKTLILSGVGYKALKEGRKLKLSLGHSHPIEIDPPSGIDFVTEGATTVKVLGADKEIVGKVAADIRRARIAEPYKAKGVKYSYEIVRRKAGKAAKTASASGG